MPKQSSEERQVADLAKLVREIVRDLAVGIPPMNLSGPFDKAFNLCIRVKHVAECLARRPAPTGLRIPPPDVQTARVMAVLGWMLVIQLRGRKGHGAAADDLLKLRVLADSLDGGKAPGGAGKEEAGRTAAELSQEALAIGAFVDHPGWTNKQIAKAAGCNPKSLYRWELFKSARAVMREGKGELPKGAKSKDGELEAYSENPKGESRFKDYE